MRYLNTLSRNKKHRWFRCKTHRVNNTRGRVTLEAASLITRNVSERTCGSESLLHHSAGRTIVTINEKADKTFTRIYRGEIRLATEGNSEHCGGRGLCTSWKAVEREVSARNLCRRAHVLYRSPRSTGARSHPSQYIFETAFHPWLQPKWNPRGSVLSGTASCRNDYWQACDTLPAY